MLDPFDAEQHGSRRCYWLGHRFNEHRHCSACGMPDWIAGERGTPALRDRVSYFIWRARVRWELRSPAWLFTRCVCGRVERVCGVRVGRHGGGMCELPF